MRTSKFIWLALVILLGVGTRTAEAATNEVSALLQQGLFEEEADRNLDAAIQAYQGVVAQTDKDRQFTATAVFRLGECYRKLGKTNEATTQYQRILREFADETDLAKLSQQNLAGMGVAESAAAAPPSAPDFTPQKHLLQQEIDVVAQELQSQQARAKSGVLPPETLSETQLKLLDLQRQLAALEAGQPVSTQPPADTTDDEDKELRDAEQMVENSPDLINGPNGPLNKAANAGELRVAAYLLDHGANVNGSPDADPPLLMAAINDQKTMVELLLNRGADVNARRRNPTGDTALLTATRLGYMSVVEVLLAHKADPNLKAQGGETPLHVAAGKGYLDLAGLLVTNGADVNAVDDSGSTPLHSAASEGNTAVMELLISHNATLDARANDGMTPLMYAAVRGQNDAAALLLKHGADVNAKATSGREAGWMPLHFAVSQNQNEVVKMLLQNHAGPNATISSYRNSRNLSGIGVDDVTPLFMAVMNLQNETVKLLVEARADVNIKDASGNSPLTLLAWINSENQNTGQPGLGGGPRIGRFVGFGPGQLDASLSDRLEIAEMLLAHGADINAQNNDQESALSLCVNNRSPEMLKVLLAHKPRVDILDKQGLTPLWHAVLMPDVKIAGLLLDSGANPDVGVASQSRDNGITMLIAAVSRTDKAMVETLLAHKANPNLRNEAGESPLSLAKSAATAPNSNPQMAEIVELLQRAGANENLERLSTISVSRGSANFQQTVFQKGADLPNHYSLLDLLAQFYEPPYRGEIVGELQLSFSFTQLPGLAFPDFGRIKINRLQKDGPTKTIEVNLEKQLTAGDCSGDVPLMWGDVVEIPEADHNVNERWRGLGDATSVGMLEKCLARNVSIIVKGQTNLVRLRPLFYRNVPMAPGIELYSGGGMAYPRGTSTEQPSFWLYDVVHNANVILTSSDLSRVKVTRAGGERGKPVEMVFDLRKEDAANALWLQDGDVIEIPEKP